MVCLRQENFVMGKTWIELVRNESEKEGGAKFCKYYE